MEIKDIDDLIVRISDLFADGFVYEKSKEKDLREIFRNIKQNFVSNPTVSNTAEAVKEENQKWLAYIGNNFLPLSEVKEKYVERRKVDSVLKRTCNLRNEFIGLRNKQEYKTNEAYYQGIVEEYDDFIKELQSLLKGGA